MIRKHAVIFTLMLFQMLTMNQMQGQDPVLWWKFDTIINGTLTEEVCIQQDVVKGYHLLVDGVNGKALKLDGYTTHVIRDAEKVPDFSNGLSIEAWIALQALPWNWSGIVSQGGNIILPKTPDPEYEHKIFFGIDAHGHIGLRLNINGKIYECISEEKLPLLKWSHVAATFDSGEGMKIYINGELSAELEVQGKITSDGGSDLLLGMNIQKLGPVGSERQASADIKSKMVPYGILDEIKIYNQPIAEKCLKENYKVDKPTDVRALNWNKLPSGPEILPDRFDGFYTRLTYTEEWEAPRRESDYPDILIHFDKLPVRFIFWRGTNYGGAWVTENGLWMGDQSVERSNAGKSPMGCSEHMSDKQSRYGNVRIIEKNDARIVVQWRYAIADIIYDIFGTSIGTVNHTGEGWGEWANEYYYIYPDGVSTRHQTLWTEFLSHEFQETIVLNHPGTYPEDNIEMDALTLANMNGDHRTYSWKNDIELMREARLKGGFSEPEKPNIQIVNLKSQYKPFIIFEPNPEITPFNPNSIRPGYSHFPWWNHWPVGQLPNDGRRALGPDRASHSSLSQSVEGSEVIHNMGDGSYEVVTLVGMTNQPAGSLAMLARSWNNAPELIVRSKDFEVSGYSKKERAFTISNRNNGPATELEFVVSASDNSPVVNPSFVIENWGNDDVALSVNGKKLSRGESFRYGFQKTLQGTDLVLWIEMRSDSETVFIIKPCSAGFAQDNHLKEAALLPSSRPEAVPFGAYSTRLKYSPEWDDPWPVKEDADVVVRFGKEEPRFVFWHGTSYIPCWATYDGAWYTNGFFERRSCTVSMAEPMSDKQTRYSSVRIIENNDARVIVHWRYAPTDFEYKMAFLDDDTNWGDWADEYYILYPDAVGTRIATLFTSAKDDWIEYHKSIVVNQPGHFPENSLNYDAVTILNLKGDSRTITWTEQGIPEFSDLPEKFCIQKINLKSDYKPFTIVPPENSKVTPYDGRAPGSRFNFQDHWPVSYGKSHTRVVDSADRPSHTSLSYIKWDHHSESDNSLTWIMMHGMDDSGDAHLVKLASSWISPAELRIVAGNYISEGYDQSQRAYLLVASDITEEVSFELMAEDKSPVVNPAFHIKNWGSSNVGLKINDQDVKLGNNFRAGYITHKNGADLIVWLRLESDEPIKITLTKRQK